MQNQWVCTHWLVLLLLCLLSGCMQGGVTEIGTAVGGTGGDQTASINLAKQANLATTTQIEIRVHNEQSGEYLSTATLTTPDTIAALVDALDQALPLQPALFCVAQSELIFQLAKGESLTFSYGCVAEEGSYLQGGDTPLQDHAIQLPLVFQELLLQSLE